MGQCQEMMGMGPGVALVNSWPLHPPIYLPSARGVTMAGSYGPWLSLPPSSTCRQGGVWTVGQAALVEGLLPEPSQHFPKLGQKEIIFRCVFCFDQRPSGQLPSSCIDVLTRGDLMKRS